MIVENIGRMLLLGTAKTQFIFVYVFRVSYTMGKAQVRYWGSAVCLFYGYLMNRDGYRLDIFTDYIFSIALLVIKINI